MRRKIGGGAFGDIFAGFDSVTDEEVAFKLEDRDVRQPQLPHEACMYKLLKGKNTGIPRIR